VAALNGKLDRVNETVRKGKLDRVNETAEASVSAERGAVREGRYRPAYFCCTSYYGYDTNTRR